MRGCPGDPSPRVIDVKGRFECGLIWSVGSAVMTNPIVVFVDSFIIDISDFLPEQSLEMQRGSGVLVSLVKVVFNREDSL
jgi:hypothetical protein